MKIVFISHSFTCLLVIVFFFFPCQQTTVQVPSKTENYNGTLSQTGNTVSGNRTQPVKPSGSVLSFYSSTNGLFAIYEDLPEPLQQQQLSSSSRIVGPYFETNQTSHNISARSGQTVMFDCEVVLLQGSGRTVSWLRRRNETLQLLTVGNQTYSSDSRLCLKFRYPSNWRLEIQQVSKKDEGEYQCQLSNHPPKTLIFHLEIIAPDLVILDENEHLISERHYKVDSFLLLTCRASFLDETDNEIGWYKGNQILPGQDESRIKVKEWKNLTIGEANAMLSILSVSVQDSGNYTCKAATSSQSSVVVHVINEKLPAAVQHENNMSPCLLYKSQLHLYSIIIMIIIDWLIQIF